jgi:hypothetical protein
MAGQYVIANGRRRASDCRWAFVIIGPEGWFYGNENFNSQRAGAFIKVPIAPRLAVTASGGFNFVANDEFFNEIGNMFSSGEFGGLGGITNGGYGTVSISTWF